MLKRTSDDIPNHSEKGPVNKSDTPLLWNFLQLTKPKYEFSTEQMTAAVLIIWTFLQCIELPTHSPAFITPSGWVFTFFFFPLYRFSLQIILCIVLVMVSYHYQENAAWLASTPGQAAITHHFIMASLKISKAINSYYHKL